MSDVFNSISVPFQSTTNTLGTPIAVQNTQVVEQQPITVKEAIAASSVQQPKQDTFQSVKPRKKEGPIKKLKRAIANFKKGCATVAEYAKGIARGVVLGAVGFCATFGGGEAINAIKTFAAKHSKSDVVPKLIKHHKGVGIVVGAAILAANIWKASLKATDARSDIHDRYIGTEKE
ncbi:hypothetical protein IJ182_04600 [bacterium]|nr:hypothetical protein [bacterium]